MDSAPSESPSDPEAQADADTSSEAPRRPRRRRRRRDEPGRDEPEGEPRPEVRAEVRGGGESPRRDRADRGADRDGTERNGTGRGSRTRRGAATGGAPRERPDNLDSDRADRAERADRPDRPQPDIHEAHVVQDDVDEDALKVIRRLRRYGHDAYLVGGGVRDLLLNVKPKDFDIATSARPNEVRSLFRNCRIIGRRFRLAHILFGGGKVIETATFRRDPTEAFDQVEGEFAEEMEALAEGSVARRRDDVDLLIRHDNVFGEPHEDALRRDFTINGLFYDSEANTVIDYVGGMPDVRGRLVRTIGPPDVRFREDPIRILRAIKFSARLDLGIHPDVYDAMVAQRDELARAARPRLLEEMLRLLRGGAAHRSYWLMWETGALGVLVPQLAVHLDDDSTDARRIWARLSAIDALKKAGELPSDSVLFATLMYGPIQDAVGGAKDPSAAYEGLMNDVLETLAVPRRMKERVRSIVYAQSRLWAGKLGALPRREYFDDAATLFAIECDARGMRRPDWLDEDRPEPDAESRPRRRRRRRQR